MQDPAGGGRRPPTPWSLLALVAVGGWAFLVGRGLRESREDAGRPVPVRETEPVPQLAARVEPRAPRALDRVWSLRVVDGRGNAHVDAEVVVGGAAGGPPIRARSDGLGLVRLRVPPRIADHAPLLVVANVDGGAAWRPLPDQSGFLGEVRLGGRFDVSGTLELPDGSPAARTELGFRRVALLGDADGRATALFDWLERPPDLAVGEVDALGRFRAEGLTPGVHLVESRLPGAAGFERLHLSSHRGSLVDLVRGDAPLELVVDGLLAELVLFDRDFNLLAEARFEIEGIDSDGEPFRRELSGSGRSEPTEVWLPPSRSLRVTASRDDLAPTFTTLDLGQDPAGVVRVEVAAPGLPGRALVRPILVGRDGAVLPHLSALERATPGGFEPLETPSRAADREWIGPLEPGRYRLTLAGHGERHPLAPDADLALAPVSVIVQLGPGEARRLEVPAPPGRRLILTVAGPSDDPLLSAALRVGGRERTLSFVPSDGKRRTRAPATAGAHLSFEALDTEAGQLLLRRRSGRETSHPIPAGHTDVELTVPR